MGRVLPIVLSLVLFLQCACVGPSATCRSHCQARWDRLCAQMRPGRTLPTGHSNASPALAPGQSEALRAAAGEMMASVVQVRTVASGAAAGGQADGPARPASLRSGGTGVVIASDGLILTNEHVVRHAKNVTVVFHDGAVYPVKAIVVHPRRDIAILQIDRTQIPSASPSQERVKPGTPVVAVSCAAEQRERCYRTGVVTSGRRSLQCELDPAGRRDYSDLVETTVRLEPGFSGGPLLDSEGRLVGLNVAVTGSPGTERHRGYAIPFDHPMREAVEQLVALSRAPAPAAP